MGDNVCWERGDTERCGIVLCAERREKLRGGR